MPMNSVEQCQALRQRRIDAGFVYALHAGSGRGDADDLTALDVAVEPLMLAVHRDNALAALPEPVSLVAFDRAPFVWFDRAISPAYDDQVMAAFARSGVSPMVVQRTTSTSAMLALVNSGVGFTFAPMSAQHRKPFDVVLRSLEMRDLDQTLRLAWRRGDTSPVLKRFVDCAMSLPSKPHPSVIYPAT